MDWMFMTGLIKLYGPVYGPALAFFLYLAWERIINPWRKKRKGTFVTWKLMHETQKQYAAEVKECNMRLGRVEEKMENFLSAQHEKERNMEFLNNRLLKTENRIDELGYIARDVSISLKTSNRLIGEIKDASEKFSTLTSRVEEFLQQCGGCKNEPT